MPARVPILKITVRHAPVWTVGDKPVDQWRRELAVEALEQIIPQLQVQLDTLKAELKTRRAA